jgi:NTE family protein
VELLKDISARWANGRRIRELAGCAANKDSPVCAAVRVPQAEIYPIDVSFAALPDKAEREYLNQQPTTFALPAEAVDRLRAAAGTIILASPEFQRLLKDVGATIVADPSVGGNLRTARLDAARHASSRSLARRGNPTSPRRGRPASRTLMYM